MIELDDNTEENLQNLLESRQQIEQQIQLIINTYTNAKGKDGDYQLDATQNGLVLKEVEDEE